MPSKNSLASFKDKPEQRTILPNDGSDRKSSSVVETPIPDKKGRVGRPPKSKDVKQGDKVTLSLDAGEWAKLDEKAGLAPKATVIHAFLKDNGFFD